MDANILLEVFGLVVGGVMFYTHFKEYNEYRKKVDPLLAKESYELYDYSKVVKFLYLVFAGFGLFSVIYGFMTQDATTVAIGLVVVGLFAGEFLTANKKYRMFYNDESFIIANEKIAYKSVNDVQEMKAIPFAFRKLTTYQGKEVRVNKKCLEIIDQKTAEEKERKKANKKK